MDRNGKIAEFLHTLSRYRYAAVAVLLGVVLMLLPSEKAEQETSKTTAEAFDRAALQQEMEQILSQIDGVGKLKLMLTVSGGAEVELAHDESQEQKSRQDSSDEFTAKSETVVLGSGANAQVVVTANRYPDFVGALVVCEGADSAAVRLQLTQAVSALTGLSSDKISIVRGKP